MKKTFSILFGIGIILAGVWVYRTRTPVVLPAMPGVSVAPDSMSLQSPSPEAAASPQTTPAANEEKSPVRKISDSLKGADQRKFLILEEILVSKNDNDMRLDTEFKGMTPALKKALTQYYQAIPAEARNDRGTIVFLLARDLKAPEEVDFLQNVLMEKPCLSLENCAKDTAQAHTGEHGHLDGIAETTAHYPQLTDLTQGRIAYLRAKGEGNTALADRLVAMFRHATGSPNARVAEEAQRVLKYIGK